jgi:hypothetical protein
MGFPVVGGKAVGGVGLCELEAAFQPWESRLGRAPFEKNVRLPEEGENLRQCIAKFSSGKLARVRVKIGYGLNGCWVWREDCDFVSGVEIEVSLMDEKGFLGHYLSGIRPCYHTVEGGERTGCLYSQLNRVFYTLFYIAK